MPFLVGISGLCGTGKSTGIEFLRSNHSADIVYLGGLVLQELDRRGLPRTPESERVVQTEIRNKHGPNYLAVLALPRVAEALGNGRDVIIDAIFNPDEFGFLKESCPDAVPFTVAIHAPFHLRCDRLAARHERPLTPDDIIARDLNEVTKLKIATAITLAQHHVVNDATLDIFQNRIRAVWGVAQELSRASR